MRAIEWWKWFWRFVAMVECSGAGVAFLAMEALTSATANVPAPGLADIGTMSVQAWFMLAAICTVAVCSWALLVTLPVLIAAEIFFASENRKHEDAEFERITDKAFSDAGVRLSDR